MPIHDWSRVDAGIFHDFHQAWTIEIRNAPVGVGDPLPPLPIFLDNGMYVPAPLETTYQATSDQCPPPVHEVVENPAPDQTG